MGKKKRRFRPVKRLLQSRAVQWLLAWLVAGYIRLVRVTSRWEIRDEAGLSALTQQEGAVIILHWHARLLLMPSFWQTKEWGPLTVMTSKHRDGAFIADVAQQFGITAVRGSSGKGGAMALRAALQALKQGTSITITPDGPRGPREQVQPGAVALARKTGRAVVPVAYSTSRGRHADSWDRFFIPYPFSRGCMIIGAPVRLEPELSPEEGSTRLQQALQHATAAADAVVGRG